VGVGAALAKCMMPQSAPMNTAELAMTAAI